MDCAICCQENIKNEITCQSCNISYCLKCAKTYLLGVQEANCMGCKKEWDERFLRTNFPLSWINKQYKEHVTNIVMEREKSYTPAMMEEIDVLKTENRRLLKNSEIRYEIELLYANIKRIEYKISILNRVNQLSNGDEILELRDEITKIRDDIVFIENTMDNNRNNRLSSSSSTAVVNYIKKCPLENCQGYLNSHYNCALCEKSVCKDCYKEKNDDHQSMSQGHQCVKEDVETVSYLLKETKPCPKCHTRISKIDGCDQMFCVHCRTAWGWNKGEIVNGPIHNPEYFRWIRESGQTLARGPGQQFQGANNECFNRETFYGILNNSRNVVNSPELIKTVDIFITGINNEFPIDDRNTQNGAQIGIRRRPEIREAPTGYHLLTHIFDNLLRYIHNHRARVITSVQVQIIDDQFEMNRQIRKDHLLNNLGEKMYKANVLKNYKHSKANNMIYNLQDTLVIVLEDTLRVFQQQMTDKDIKKDVFSSLINYIKYFNEESRNVSDMFGYSAVTRIELRFMGIYTTRSSQN